MNEINHDARPIKIMRKCKVNKNIKKMCSNDNELLNIRNKLNQFYQKKYNDQKSNGYFKSTNQENLYKLNLGIIPKRSDFLNTNILNCNNGLYDFNEDLFDDVYNARLQEFNRNKQDMLNQQYNKYEINNYNNKYSIFHNNVPNLNSINNLNCKKNNKFIYLPCDKKVNSFSNSKKHNLSSTKKINYRNNNNNNNNNDNDINKSYENYSFIYNSQINNPLFSESNNNNYNDECKIFQNHAINNPNINNKEVNKEYFYSTYNDDDNSNNNGLLNKTIKKLCYNPHSNLFENNGNDYNFKLMQKNLSLSNIKKKPEIDLNTKNKCPDNKIITQQISKNHKFNFNLMTISKKHI